MALLDSYLGIDDPRAQPGEKWLLLYREGRGLDEEGACVRGMGMRGGEVCVKGIGVCKEGGGCKLVRLYMKD